MDNLICFATYNIFFDKNPERIKEIKFIDNIYFGYRKDPSYLHWNRKDNMGSLICTQKPSKEKLDEILKEYDQAYQLLIYAENELIAQNISNLIHGGRLLDYPSISKNPECTDIYYSNYDGLAHLFEKTEVTENMLFACLVAWKSWNNKPLIYSIEKYRFSLRLDSITPNSASPRHGQVFSIKDRGYDYHVNTAYSFFSAYTILEELKLAINTGPKKKRFIDGDWNPIVKKDILKRLNNIGILESETFDWVIRGNYTKIYQKIEPVLGNRSDYYDNEIIFDRTLKIYEAIHYASYIRGFFIAHKFNEVVSEFNPYDVHNIQCLTRRLILSKLELWNFNVNDNS